MDKGYKKAINQRYSVWRNNSNTSSRELYRFSKHLSFIGERGAYLVYLWYVLASWHVPSMYHRLSSDKVEKAWIERRAEWESRKEYDQVGEK
jgi:hypothetical protein